MLFNDTNDMMYNEGLIEDVESVDLQTNETFRATLGIVRTPTGFQVDNSSRISTASDMGNEEYMGDTIGMGSSEWVPITSADLYNLRLLGVDV